MQPPTGGRFSSPPCIGQFAVWPYCWSRHSFDIVLLCHCVSPCFSHIQWKFCSGGTDIGDICVVSHGAWTAANYLTLLGYTLWKDEMSWYFLHRAMDACHHASNQETWRWDFARLPVTVKKATADISNWLKGYFSQGMANDAELE